MKTKNTTIRLTESNLSVKKYRTKESKIIKENFNKVIRKNKTITYNQLFESISRSANQLYLNGHSSKHINEGIFDTIGDLFGKAPGGFMQTLKEKAFRWLLPKLGFSGGFLDFMVITLSNMPISDYKIFLSPLDNCEKIADHLTDGVMEWLATVGLKKMDIGGGFLSDTIRNTVGEMLTDEGFVQQMQDKFSPIICNKIRSAFGGGDTGKGAKEYVKDIFGSKGGSEETPSFA